MITLLSSLARPCSCLYFTKNIHKGGRSENKILLSIDNMSFGRQTDNSVQDQQLPNRSFWKAITILPFRYEDCWVLLFDLFHLQLLYQWQCAVTIQKLSCLASLKPPTHSPIRDLSTCFASLSSLLASWAQLTSVLWPQLYRQAPH